MDFKGTPRGYRYVPFSVVDDCSRFCLALEPLRSQASEFVWGHLWDVFGEYGLPDCLLCDNAFNNNRGYGPTQLQARLWRLGVGTTHGRPSHPQTQGKVERFHRTLEEEYHGLLYQHSLEAARIAFRELRFDYNWERPHQALGMRKPGPVYTPSRRKRPDCLPPIIVPEGAVTRKVDIEGKIHYHGRRLMAGRGLIGEWVEIRHAPNGEPIVYYAGMPMRNLG
jgi:transposase InsO family protein